MAAIGYQKDASLENLPELTATGLPSVDIEAARLHAAATTSRRRRGATDRRGRAKAAAGILADAVPASVRGTRVEQVWVLYARLSGDFRPRAGKCASRAGRGREPHRAARPRP